MAVVLAAALGVAALVAAVVGVRAWPLWRVLRQVRPATPQRLVDAARDGRYEGRVVAVAGIAAPGPEGALSSVVNQVSCVWHRHTVHRRRIRYRTTANGVSQHPSVARQVADVTSTDPFRLGPVEVMPVGMRVYRPVACATRILPALASDPFPDTDMLMGYPPYRFRHREWVLRPGSELLVLGQVRSSGSRITLRRPDRGPHVISTRPIGRVRLELAVAAVGGLATAAAAAVAGVVLAIVHFV